MFPISPIKTPQVSPHPNSSPNSLPPKPVSMPCLTGPSSQIGPVKAMSGKPGGALAQPTPPPSGFFPSLHSTFSHKVANYLFSHLMGPGSDFTFVPATSASTLDSAPSHTSTTTRAIFSQTGILFQRCTPSLVLPGQRAFGYQHPEPLSWEHKEVYIWLGSGQSGAEGYGHAMGEEVGLLSL
jgi:hypothetical protein